MAHKQQRSQHRLKEHQEEVERAARRGDGDSRMQAYREQAMETVDEYPIAVTFAALGLGLGLGVLIGSSLAGSRNERFDRQAASIGRRVLESLSDMVPASLRG